jgi:non-ribosomal peptide synthetase component E (peptide arylation enzyme)
MQFVPAELEAVLLSHAAEADAAVVALEDEAAGETPRVSSCCGARRVPTS